MRPRLCRVCHRAATHVEEELRPTVHIHLDGSKSHGHTVISVYYCSMHNGSSGKTNRQP